MNEAVSDIIAARGRAQDSLGKAVTWSIAAHAVVLGVLMVAPHSTEAPPARTVMTISLGGTPGVRSEGLTQAGGRQVQEVAPPQPTRRAEAPSAPSRPAMTLPDPKARPRPQTPNRTQNAPAPSASRTPTTGEQVSEGTPGATQRVRGQGFGLSTSGGGGLGGITLDSDFCCPEYLELMVGAIRQNWSQKQGVTGTTTMKFVIQRNGQITNPQVMRSSGFIALDQQAMRALQLARLPPLPAAFTNQTLGVQLHFDYTQ